MVNLLNFMRKHKCFIFVISILLFVVPLVIVHLLYMIDCKITWLKSQWNAGDALSYTVGFEAFIGTMFLGFLALWQNHLIQEEHIESKEPLLSMRLINENEVLYLVIENNGGVEAKDIRIEVLNIYNNGKNNDLCLDGLFDTVFELYPKEKVRGRVALSDESIFTEIFPQVKLEVSYTRPDLKIPKRYERTVVYNSEVSQVACKNAKVKDNKIASDIETIVFNVDKIAGANVRIANYLDGCKVAKFDSLDIVSKSSLKTDFIEIMDSSRKAPICDRLINNDKSLENKLQEENKNE